MRFDYAMREVDPLPGESGLQIIHEPIVLVRFAGPARSYLIRGLLETGAAMTLLPRFYLTKLGLSPSERVRLRAVGERSRSRSVRSNWSCGRPDLFIAGPHGLDSFTVPTTSRYSVTRDSSTISR